MNTNIQTLWIDSDGFAYPIENAGANVPDDSTIVEYLNDICSTIARIVYRRWCAAMGKDARPHTFDVDDIAQALIVATIEYVGGDLATLWLMHDPDSGRNLAVSKIMRKALQPFNRWKKQELKNVPEWAQQPRAPRPGVATEAGTDPVRSAIARETFARIAARSDIVWGLSVRELFDLIADRRIGISVGSSVCWIPSGNQLWRFRQTVRADILAHI